MVAPFVFAITLIIWILVQIWYKKNYETSFLEDDIIFQSNVTTS